MKNFITLGLLFFAFAGYSQIAPVNIGTAIGNNTGDGARTSFTKLNQGLYALDQKGTASGTDTYTVTITAPAPGYTTGIAAIAVYTTGQRFFITFTNANTGASTLAVNGLSARPIVKVGGTALVLGDINAGETKHLYYDGTNFKILGGSGSGGGGTWGSITGTLSTQSDLNTALGLKAPLASPTFTGTVSGITAAMVGLGNVSNTSDANKPVSTAQQTALDLKANLAGPTFTGTVVLPSTTSIGTVSNTELGFVDGLTSSAQTQIDSKQATLVSATNIKTINGSTILGSGDLLVSGLDLATTSTAGGTITLDLLGRAQRMFVGSAAIGGNKTIALSNATSGLVLHFNFTLTGGLYTLTFPSNFFMQNTDSRWAPGSKIWTPTQQGTYEASATYNGTNWHLVITDPYN